MSLISVLTPVYNPEPAVLDAAIKSVLSQTYDGWELCLVDDCSTDPAVRHVLDTWSSRDRRIRVQRRTTNGGISNASNDALLMARGDIIALLDHDDTLAPDALGAVNHAFVTHRDADVVYTDEDKIDLDGSHREPFRKPPWSPDYLAGCMYIGHLAAYRTSLVRSVGGFTVGCEGSQDWDLALRATEHARRVHHIPEILYHWRMSAASVALDVGAKPWAVAAARRAVEAHAARRHGDAVVEDSGHPGWFLVRRSLEELPRVTAVIPTAGSMAGEDVEPYRLVDRCLEQLLDHTDYPALDIVVVISANAPDDLQDELPETYGHRVRTVRLEGAFNYSRSINAGVLRSTSPYVLLLNDDTEPLSPDWLVRLVEAASEPEVGVVGAKLLYPGGLIQHAGVVHTSNGLPFHPHAAEDDDFGYFGEKLLTMNYSAVTGACQLMRRTVFDEVGGYDTELPLNYNDIDFCLRVGARGYRVVQLNAARLVHHESVTRPRGVHSSEQELFQSRWGHQTRHDGYLRRALRPL
ncbi:MAG: glycosyltransferase [Mycobacteriales bacterium]